MAKRKWWSSIAGFVISLPSWHGSVSPAALRAADWQPIGPEHQVCFTNTQPLNHCLIPSRHSTSALSGRCRGPSLLNYRYLFIYLPPGNQKSIFQGGRKARMTAESVTRRQLKITGFFFFFLKAFRRKWQPPIRNGQSLIGLQLHELWLVCRGQRSFE